MKVFEDLTDEQRAAMLGSLTSSLTSDVEKLAHCVVVWLIDELKNTTPAPKPVVVKGKKAKKRKKARKV